MSASSRYEDLVEALLESEGFRVERIATEKDLVRADFRLRDNADEYVVEVKTKLDDERFEQALARDGHATSSKPLTRSNTLEAIAEKAVRQLEATPAGPTALRLLAFVAAGAHPEAQLDQLDATLWGAAELLDLDEIGEGTTATRRCYFFDRAVLRHFPNLDAVLAIWPHKGGQWIPAGRMHPNPWSPRLGRLKTCGLYCQLASGGGVVDPAAEEEAGEAFIADCDSIPLDAEGPRLLFVQKKYGRPRLTRLTPHHFVSTLQVPWRGA